MAARGALAPQANSPSLLLLLFQELPERGCVKRPGDPEYTRRAVGVAGVDKDVLHTALLVNDCTRGMEAVSR